MADQTVSPTREPRRIINRPCSRCGGLFRCLEGSVADREGTCELCSFRIIRERETIGTLGAVLTEADLDAAKDYLTPPWDKGER